MYQLQTSQDASSIWTMMGSRVDGPANGDYFGKSVSLSGDGSRVAVGAPYADPEGQNSGLTQVFEWNSELLTWAQLGSDIYGDYGSMAGAQIGSAVSLSSDGNTLLSTARRHANYRGMAKVVFLDPCDASLSPANG